MARKKSIDTILRRREAEDEELRGALDEINAEIARLLEKRRKIEGLLVSVTFAPEPASEQPAPPQAAKDRLTCADCGATFPARDLVSNECPRCFAAPFEEAIR